MQTAQNSTIRRFVDFSTGDYRRAVAARGIVRNFDGFLADAKSGRTLESICSAAGGACPATPDPPTASATTQVHAVGASSVGWAPPGAERSVSPAATSLFR